MTDTPPEHTEGLLRIGEVARTDKQLHVTSGCSAICTNTA